LTTCEYSKVILEKSSLSDRFPISGLAFSHFLVQSCNLRVLGIGYFGLDTCHCRAIDGLTRTDLQIELVNCKPSESGEEILLESIRQNRGSTTLSECRIDTRRLADSLRGNNSVATLALHQGCSDEDRLVLVQALTENEGIVTLYLNSAPISDEFWIASWRSVARHPKLKKIILPSYGDTWKDGNTDAQKTLKMQTMVDELCVNTALHTIEELNRCGFDGQCWTALYTLSSWPAGTGHGLVLSPKWGVRCAPSCSVGLWARYPVNPL
jgi:hypothetical protein